MQPASHMAVLVGCILLGGCVENLPEAKVARGDVRNAIARGAVTSPRAATVALASLEGAPDPLSSRFDQAFRKEAADREIAIAEPASAHYLVRGYLSAYAADTGTAVSYVYDIFDANDRRRIDRVTDVITVQGSAADAWALVDDRVMASLAGRSADDLAAALAGTPVAQAARGAQTAATDAPVKPVN